MSDAIDDAARPPQRKIGREVGNVAGSARQARDLAAGSPQHPSAPK
jgi:hypothetical protein